MRGRKKQSDASEPTQPERPKRFVRRNSFCTINCRSGSLNKYPSVSQQLTPSSPNPERTLDKPSKLHTETQKFFKEMQQPFQPVLRRCSGSMRVDTTKVKEQNLQSQRMETIRKELQTRTQEVQLLQGQCKRLKIYIGQEREKRKTLEEEAKCNQQEIKRLERRLEKYKAQKANLEKEKETMLIHIQELEDRNFNQDNKLMQSYREKYQDEEIKRLRIQLEKGKAVRQKQLVVQVEALNELKYQLEADLKAAIVANTALKKQIEETQQQMDEIRYSAHQNVICSTQYMELRERYKRMLIQFKELKDELSVMERSRLNEGRALLENTILTVSESNDSLWKQ